MLSGFQSSSLTWSGNRGKNILRRAGRVWTSSYFITLSGPRGQAPAKPALRKEIAMPPYTGSPVYAGLSGSSGSPGSSGPSRPLEDLIAVARKQRPAALVIKNTRFFNAFTGEFASGDVAVQGGCIAGMGQYDGAQEWDAAGAYLVPGFIDSHVHLESAMASPAEYARVVVPHGTSAVVVDPHEIANVAGAEGLAYILEATENLPLTVYVMLPSCVPASPLEWGGARLTAADLAPFLNHPRVLGLGEMMNFPGVLSAAPEVMAKLRLALDWGEGQGQGRSAHLRIDGHSPGLSGADLQAYVAAGISSDHECSTLAEARERLSLGMAVMLRQGTAAKNLLDLLPAVTEHTAPLCLLATDDIHLNDLMREGHINYLVKLAAADGRVPLSTILRMAALNPAQHYDLRGCGAIAPGFRADFALYPDLETWRPDAVWYGGELAAQAGECVWMPPASAAPADALPGRERIYNSVRLPDLGPEDLKIRAASAKARVIGIVPGQIVTEHLILELPAVNGAWEADPAADIAKLAVVERHRNSGHVGLGLVKGLGLARGAIASTVAHDSHNLVAAGASDADMLAAIAALGQMRGGLVAVESGRVLAALPLPLAGLLSDLAAPDIAAAMAGLHAAAQTLRNGAAGDVFMLLSFLSLPVIPKLKLTEAGLVDVEAFKVVDVAV